MGAFLITVVGAALLSRGGGSDDRGGRIVGSGDSGDGPPPAAASVEVHPAFSGAALAWILEPVQAQLEEGAFPGAAVAVGLGSREVREIGEGFIGWTKNAPPVDPDRTMYDLASLTKVVATATATMLLVDEGRMSLDDPVAKYLPEFGAVPKDAVTIRHLLTHTSGLPEGATLEGENRAARIARAARFPIYPPAGARVQYSDVGFILLWEAAEIAAGEPLTDYLDRRLFGPLGMVSTRFSPGLDCEECAPTGRLRDQSLYRGRPFDPLGQRLDGVGGSSGLFSTARDLGRFMAMIANGGELDGVRVLSEEAVAEFTGPQPVGGRFRLGWEMYCPDDADGNDACRSSTTLHHTGWTGTSIHLDTATGAWVVLLTNRTYEPRVDNRISAVRREVVTRLIERVNQPNVTVAATLERGRE